MDRRTKLLRLLAQIDQQIREAESLATDVDGGSKLQRVAVEYCSAGSLNRTAANAIHDWESVVALPSIDGPLSYDWRDAT